MRTASTRRPPIVRTYAEAHPREKLLIGFGACGHLVREGRLPNREDLDRWVARPLIIVKYDGHAAVCNSAMMSFFSSKVTDDPGFHADGWLYQSAFYNGVNEVTAKLSPLSIVGGLSKGAAALTAAGIGLVHAVEGVGYPRDMDVDMLRMLEGGLPQTFRIFFQTMDVSKVLKRRMKRIGGCFELALDGCFGSEDAALLAPYTNNPDNRGRAQLHPGAGQRLCHRRQPCGPADHHARHRRRGGGAVHHRL